jgi:hypothetical protein
MLQRLTLLCGVSGWARSFGFAPFSLQFRAAESSEAKFQAQWRNFGQTIDLSYL